MDAYSDEARAVLDIHGDSIVATKTTLLIKRAPRPLLENELVALVAGSRTLRVAIILSWDFHEWSLPGVKQLVESGALRSIRTFTLGWIGGMPMKIFFEILANMPSLTHLTFGLIVRDEHPPSELSTPACKLSHLLVEDSMGIAFAEYPLLLSRSHSTLAHVEIHWVNDAICGERLRVALERCSRVRHLTLVGCVQFDHSSILRACPKLRSLEVETDTLGSEDKTRPMEEYNMDEVTLYFKPKARALPPRQIQEINLYNVMGQAHDFFTECEFEWRENIAPHTSSCIRTLRIPVLGGAPLASRAYVTLKEWCKAHRVHISLSSPRHWEKVVAIL
ncbi:hypothetical protein BKA62DRAFT_416284 [Auriculariales sp. MPI-PUGE-AT-0066]|nr:hypothetical protein BKA62DRAFT_416284 [Auriculariales sp. MPI-PUGE-AT-0066]